MENTVITGSSDGMSAALPNLSVVTTNQAKDGDQHGVASPSRWVQRWAHLVPAGGVVLDVACGHGRHAHFFHERNHPVTLVDRSQIAVESIALPAQTCEKVVADIERGPWPFAGRQFDAVVVTNYLWRALLPTLLKSLAPGGLMIYETFTQGQESVGRPSRPDFLLRTGELLQVFSSLRVVGFEDGFLEEPGGQTRFVQRIAAVREDPSPADSGSLGKPQARRPHRYSLL